MEASSSTARGQHRRGGSWVPSRARSRRPRQEPGRRASLALQDLPWLRGAQQSQALGIKTRGRASAVLNEVPACSRDCVAGPGQPWWRVLAYWCQGRSGQQPLPVRSAAPRPAGPADGPWLAGWRLWSAGSGAGGAQSGRRAGRSPRCLCGSRRPRGPAAWTRPVAGEDPVPRAQLCDLPWFTRRLQSGNPRVTVLFPEAFENHTG